MGRGGEVDGEWRKTRKYKEICDYWGYYLAWDVA